MFTPKSNSKQKSVKKVQRCKNRSSDCTHGSAAQCRATRTARAACRANGRARLTTQIFQFFTFTVSHIKFKLLIR